MTKNPLRHSFDMLIVEKGVPPHAIKQLLGHGNIKTTGVYLHIPTKYMTEIESPLEGLNL